ncbi:MULTISPECIES: YesL family protein [Bacillaceae]|uniref:YesL family protein n=1 Tax=Bacillales TaxID=1385 RepID=UPI001CFE037D|nr:MULTISPECIES: DUF624 domain-containing protein [Bacillaceae]MDO6656837.1 DUF624 domain-containing protein [Anaerobacillus sp. 1_MG-2023]WLR60063.1 DUF624 domain-containing protein [Pseudalkalibacillus hwajinpoensis]
MVELNGLWGKFYRITEWVARLVYVQCLWLVFSIVGLLVAGIFPATMGMFAVVRRWQLGETDVPVFPEFWTTYKQEFIKANLVGWLTTIVGGLLLFNLTLFRGYEGVFFLICYLFTLTIIFLYSLTALFVAPVFVQYKLSALKVIKYAAIIALSYPLHALMMGAIMIAFYYVLLLVPGLLPIFSFSWLAFLLMWVANLVFRRMDQKEVQK